MSFRVLFSWPCITALAALLAGASAGAWLRPAPKAPVEGRGLADLRADSPLDRKTMGPATPTGLVRLLAATSPEGQLRVALAFAELASVDEIRDLLKARARFPRTAAGRAAVAVLLQRWLALDREGALAHCRDQQPESLAPLLLTWRRTEPEAADAWAETLLPEFPAWAEFCIAMGDVDAKKAWTMLTEIPVGVLADRDTYFLNPIAPGLPRKNLAAAVLAQHTMPGPIQGLVSREIARRLTEDNAEEGWAWALRQPKAAGAPSAAFGALLRDDPLSALRLLGGLSAEDQYHVGTTVQDRPWTVTHEAEAAARLAADPRISEDTKGLLSAHLLDRFSPGVGKELLPLVTEEIRGTLIGNFVKKWHGQDPAAVSAWIETLPQGEMRTSAESAQAFQEKFPEPEDRSDPASLAVDLKKNRGLHEEDPRWSRLSAEDCHAILDKCPLLNTPDSPDQLPYFRGDVLGFLSQLNPEPAARWFEKQTIDNITGPEAAEFTAKWANQDPAAAGAWVRSLPDGDLARTAAANVARQYFRHDPAGAEAWAASLPAGHARNAARLEMLNEANAP